MLLRTASIVALALPAIGCAPAKIVNTLVPDEGYRIVRDLAYGPGPRHGLDLYIPNELSGSAPVVVFFYGGRWESGSKADYLFVGEALASEGFIAAISDYRLYPEVRFPAFVEDGAAAVRWVRDHARSYGGDPARIFLAGHSAGAHIAALLALDDHYLAAEGMDRVAIDGLIGLAGPYDFLPIRDPTVQAIFATRDKASTQPITFADRAASPALLLHGEADQTVDPKNSLRLAAAIAAAGGAAAAHLYPDVGHVALIAALAAPFRWRAAVLEDIAAFIRDPEAARPQT